MAADPSARVLLGLGWLVTVAAIDAVAGQYGAAFVLLALACGWLGVIAAREIRNRRWERRTARWAACPALWIVLDAVRDREARRAVHADAWSRLTMQLGALAEGLATGLEGVAIDASATVSRISRTFDAHFRGFGDLILAEYEETPEEVRWL